MHKPNKELVKKVGEESVKRETSNDIRKDPQLSSPSTEATILCSLSSHPVPKLNLVPKSTAYHMRQQRKL